MGMFKFSRSAVNEADLLGLQYLFKAGYDPQAAVGLLRKLGALEGTRPKQNTVFSSHPSVTERIELTEKHIRLVLRVRANHVVNTPEFEDIKDRGK